MIDHQLEFTLHTRGTSRCAPLSLRQAVIAGWTGRDPLARDKHIAELEALGVARPVSTPIYYRVAAARFTSSPSIEVSGEASSGEVEFALIRATGTTFLGVASDHTDRKVETYNITVSKQMCDKPIASELWHLDDVQPHWDQLILRSHATIAGEKHLYQEGTLSGMLPADELVHQGFGAAGLPDGCVLLGGTFAAKGGIRPATRFDFEIHDPVLGRTIRHGYDVISLPIVG